MFNVIAMLVTMLGAGYGMRRFELVGKELARDLNQLVFYLTLPALVFVSLHAAPLDLRMAVLPALAWLITLLGLGTGWLISKWLALPKPRAGAVMLFCALANTTFMGYPIIEGFYGAHHLSLAILFDLFGSSLAANLIGVWVGSRMGTNEQPIWASIKKLLGFPPLWAMALAFATRGLTLPDAATSILGRVGGLTTPLVMLTIGLSLEFRRLHETWKLVGLVSLTRLVLLPLIMLTIARAIALPVPFQQVAVLEAAMPCMFFSLTLAWMFDLDRELVVDGLVVTLGLSLVTLPIWRWVLG